MFHFWLVLQQHVKYYVLRIRQLGAISFLVNFN